MVQDRLIGKDEVKRLLGTKSDQMAWRIIKELNKELEELGYKTLSGKVSLAYLAKRYLPGGIDETYEEVDGESFDVG